MITRRLTHNTFSTYSSLVTKPTVSFLNAVSSIWKRKKFLQRVKVAGKKSYVRSGGVWENLRSAGAKLEETGLSFGGSSLVLELLNLSPLSLPLLLQPPDSYSVLGCAHITISHARHLLLVLSFNFSPPTPNLNRLFFVQYATTRISPRIVIVSNEIEVFKLKKKKKRAWHNSIMEIKPGKVWNLNVESRNYSETGKQESNKLWKDDDFACIYPREQNYNRYDF